MTIDICQFPFIISPISLFIVWVLFWYGKSMGFGCKKRIEFLYILYIYQIFLLKKLPELNVQKESIKQHWNFFHHVVSIKLKVFLENDRITIILEYHEFLYCQMKKVVLSSKDE